MMLELSPLLGCWPKFRPQPSQREWESRSGRQRGSGLDKSQNGDYLWVVIFFAEELFVLLIFFCKTESSLFFFSPFSLGPMFRKWEAWSSQQNRRRQHSLGKVKGKSQGKWSLSLRDSIQMGTSFKWEHRLTMCRFQCLRKWCILHVYSANHP